MNENDYTSSTTALSRAKSGTGRKKRPRGAGYVLHYKDERHANKPYLAFYKDANGKQHSKGFKKKTEADEFLNGLWRDQSAVEALTYSGETIASYSDTFESKIKRKFSRTGKKQSSLDTKIGNLELVKKYLGKYKLEDIDSALVEYQLIDNLWEEGYSESVMKKVRALALELLKSAAADHIIRTVPIFDFPIPVQKDAEERGAETNYLHEDEMAKYEEECLRLYTPGRGAKNKGKTIPVHVCGDRLLFLLHSGLRLGEALALTWDDYDDRSKTYIINKNLVMTSKGLILQRPKTEAGKRLVIINKTMYADLQRLRSEFDWQTEDINRREEAELKKAVNSLEGQELREAKKQIKSKYKNIRAEHKYVCGSTSFPYGCGGHNATRIAHNKICEAIGLDHKVTVHGLRHSYITWYYLRHCNDPDFDLVLFSRSIGHASVRTTLEIYAHLNMTVNRLTERKFSDLKDF